MSRRLDPLAWGALVCALAVTASAEYTLARAAGFGPWVAAGVPGALDIYALRAMRARRDVAVVVGAMIAVQALAHLVAAHLLAVSVPLVVAVSTIAPLVLWRVHRIDHQAPEVDTRTEPVNATVDTPAPTAQYAVSTPVLPEPREAEEPQVIAVDTEVDTLVNTPAEVDTPPADRLDSDAARDVIEWGWVNGMSVRETAQASTRSPSYVQRLFTQLQEERGPRPAPGQLALVKGVRA